MKKTMLLIVAFILILVSTAYANDKPQTIINEYEFTSRDMNFDYEAPMEITEGEIVYQRKSIDYEIIIEEPIYTTETKIFSKEITKEGLPKKDDAVFEDSIEISEDGYKGYLSLKEIIYTDRKVTGRTASHKVEYDYGLQAVKPDPSPTIDVLYYDEETNINVLVTLSFNKLKKTTKSQWKNNIIVQQTYRSIFNDEYLLNDGTRLTFLSDVPQIEGIEDKILSDMRMDNKNYMIIDSCWTDEAVTKEGITSRLASFTVKRLVTGYKAIYSGRFDIPNMLVYDVTAIYESELTKQVENGTEYTVKAIVTYEEIVETAPDMSDAIPILISTSTGIIGLCGLVIFIIKRRKKKKKNKTSSNLVSSIGQTKIKGRWRRRK